MEDIEGSGSSDSDCGSFSGLLKLNDSTYKASGVAYMPHTNDPADAVVLSYENKEGKSLLFTMENADSTNWTKKFSVSKIPYDTIVLNAWAFSANTGKAYKLLGSQLVIK